MIRMMILFVGLPLINRLSKLLFDYEVISRRAVNYLEFYPRFFYIFGWYLLAKTILLTICYFVIDFWNNYQVSLEYQYNLQWTFYVIGSFGISYLLCQVHLLIRRKIGKLSKYLAILGLIMEGIFIAYHTYHLVDQYGIDYLKNDLIWQQLLGISLINRYLFELMLRSLD